MVNVGIYAIHGSYGRGGDSGMIMGTMMVNRPFHKANCFPGGEFIHVFSDYV